MNASWIDFANGRAAVWAEAMWRASWQGAVAGLIAWLLCTWLKKMPYSVKCMIWWLVCLKTLLALSSGSIGLAVLPDEARDRSTNEVVTRAHISSLPAAGSSHAKEQTVGPTEYIGVGDLSPEVYLMGLWTLGVGLFGWAMLRSLARTYRIARKAHDCDNPAVLAEADEIATSMGLRCRPRLVISTETRDVLTVGVGRPAVLLSQQTLDACSPEERRMILAHEFAHLQRHDGWLGLIPQLVQIVFFFHPATWLACHEFSLAREGDCDQSALETVPSRPDLYGQLLLRLGVRPGRDQTLCAPGVSSHFRVLKGRIAMLGSFSLGSRRRPRRSLNAAFALIALLCVSPISLVHGQVVSGEKAKVGNGQAAKRPSQPKPHRSKSLHHARRGHFRRGGIAKPPTKVAQTVSSHEESLSTSVFTLQYAQSSKVAELLRRVFKSGSVEIASDDRTNSIVVRGTKTNLADVASVVVRLDMPTRPEGRSESVKSLKVYPLRNTNAEETAKTLRANLSKGSPASVAVDTYSNSIIVSADKERLDEASRMVKRLDAPAAHGSLEFSVHIVQLKHASTETVLKALARFRVKKGVKSMLGDNYSNSLVIACWKDEFEEIAQAIKKVDVP